MTVQRIYLLGAFEVVRDGKPLTASDWRNQQTRTILKLLLTHRGHVVPADQLLELLWPDADPDIARRSLHVRISQLRRALNPNIPDAYILTVEGGYVFSPDADCWIDAVEFEARAQWGRRCQESGALAEAITAYETARSLYRGAFLEEDLYADWAYADRERLHECFLTGLAELAECYARQGHYRRAITRCREVLAADSCRESVYVRLMLYHYYAGEQDRALRVYERCRQVLADELGVEPLPQTTALYEQILRRQVQPVDGAVHYPSPVYEGQLFEVPYSLGQTPFVGREWEYAWVVEHLQRTAGAGAVVAIAGEAGLGKTRLAQQALGYVQGQGWRVLSSRCYEIEAKVPYQPLIEALQPLVTGNVALAPEWLTELARLFPGLRSPAAHPQSLAEGQQGRLFEAVSQLLTTAAATQPIVVFIDDAQWADMASLTLLGHLTHRAAGARLAWLIAYRPEEASPDHPLRALLSDLRHNGRLAELDLMPLPPDAVAALVAQMAGETPLSSVLGARLTQESGGNPFFLVSILQNLFEEGVLSVAADGAWMLSRDLVAAASELMLPPTLRETLERRLSRLERGEQRLIEAAAVLGRRFNFDLLERTVGMDEETLLNALDRLVESRLLEERPFSESLEYDFSHDKLREVAYLCTGAARRRQLHRRAAGALVGLSGDAPGIHADLAYHYHQAGQIVEAVVSAMRAGEHALGLYALQQAAGHFESAVKWAEEAGLAIGQEQLAAIHIGWGDALRRSGRYDEALPHYVTALSLAQGEQKQVAAYHIGSLGLIRGGSLAEFNRMVSAFEQELAGKGDTWALAWLRWTQGFVAGIQGDAGRTRECGAAGWRVARRLAGLDDPMPLWLAMMAYTGMARAHEWWADWRRAAHFADKALALCTTANNLNGVAASCVTLGCAYHGLGEWQRALAYLERSRSLATDAGDPRLQGEALYNVGRVALERGDWATTEESARRVLAVAESSGDVVRQAEGRLLLARLSMCSGAPQEALLVLQLLLQAARWSQMTTFVVFVLRALAEAHLLAGSVREAVATAREGIELTLRTGQKRERGGLLRVLGEALARSGEQQEAGQCLREAVALAERIGCRYDLAEAQRGLGGLCAATGAAEAAREHLTAALALFESLGAAHNVAATRQLLLDITPPQERACADG